MSRIPNENNKNIIEYSFTANKDTLDGKVTVKVYNTKKYEDLKITKSVISKDDTELGEEQKQTFFKFTVTLGGITD